MEKLPTSEQLDQAAAAFDLDWGGVDQVLYGICHGHPGHSSRRAVSAKVALIDRVYAAGLERRSYPRRAPKQISKIVSWLITLTPLVR